MCACARVCVFAYVRVCACLRVWVHTSVVLITILYIGLKLCTSNAPYRKPLYTFLCIESLNILYDDRQPVYPVAHRRSFETEQRKQFPGIDTRVHPMMKSSKKEEEAYKLPSVQFETMTSQKVNVMSVPSRLSGLNRSSFV